MSECAGAAGGAPRAMDGVAHGYAWLGAREAILARPDTHVGSVVPREVTRAVLGVDGAAKLVVATVSPAFEKCFDEVFTNALDHAVRDRGMRALEVHVDRATGVLRVRNDGSTAIPTGAWSAEVAIPVPQVLFHELNSGSNFDDARAEMVGGRNGVGAKAACYMAEWFHVAIENAAERTAYAQRFADNGAVVHPPTRARYAKKTSWVDVTWRPDYARLGVALPLDDAAYDFLVGRVVDGAACKPAKVRLSLNGADVPLKGLRQYAARFGGALLESLATWAKEDDVASPGVHVVVAEAPAGRAPVRVCLVNGVRCRGTLLDAVARDLCAAAVGRGAPKAKEDIVAACVDLFVVARVRNPRFDAQSKALLETPAREWGFAVPPLDKAAKKVQRLARFVEEMEAHARRLDSKAVAKAQKATGARTANIPKYERALQVGRTKAPCTLFLTEGDSAKGTVVAGFSVVGRETNGVFPLRGKLVNTFGMQPPEALKNAEVANLVAILGLDVTKEYDAAAASKLPYRRLMIVTDMDVDGSHITGLVLAFFAHFVPSLLRAAPDFLGRLATPLIKAQLRGATHEFHSQRAFDAWRASGARPTSVRYYKGLGTSTAAEAKEYFRRLRQNSCVLHLDAEAPAALHLMFSKAQAAGRKDVLKAAAAGEVDYAHDRVPITRFVHTELVTYGRYSMKRAIPSVVDGLKPSQRKILHVVRRLKDDRPHKVAQLAADVAKETSYHHGEVSLAAAIVGMAQEWVGANQVALLRADGNFGDRHGTTAASPRYVFTRASEKAKELFPAADDAVLALLEEENHAIEPAFFVPILPVLLVNGCTGIATGWSTNVYTHGVVAVAERCLLLAEEGLDAALPPLHPSFPGFTGATEVVDDGAVVCTAAVRVDGKSLHITDLPPGMATYAVIERLQARDDVREVLNRSLDDAVDVLVEFKEKVPDDPIQALKLSAHLSLKNMHAFDAEDTLVRYETANDVVRAHAAVRLATYERRFAHQIGELDAAMGKLAERRRVVQLALASEPWSKSRTALVAELGEPSASAVRKLTLDDVTADAARELEAKADALKTEIEAVRALTPGGVWADELRAYLAAFGAQKRARE